MTSLPSSRARPAGVAGEQIAEQAEAEATGIVPGNDDAVHAMINRVADLRRAWSAP
jgi:hypothetical protein